MASLPIDQPWCVLEQLDIPIQLRERILAICEHDQSKQSGDVETLDDLLRQRFSTTEEWLSLAQAGIILERLDVVRHACDSAAMLGLTSARCMCVFAGLQQEIGEYQKAEDSFKRAIDCEPQSAFYVYRLGTFLLERGRPQEVIHIYESFLENDSNEFALGALADIYASCAVAKLGLGRYEEAIEVLLALLSIDSEHCDFNFLMGLSLKGLKEYEQAADFFRKSLPQRKYGIDVVLPLADCLRQIDRPDLAVIEYLSALEMNHNDSDREALILNMSQMYFRLGDNQRAIAMYEGILSASPGHILASYLLLAALSICGRPQVSRMKLIARDLWSSFRSIPIEVKTDKLSEAMQPSLLQTAIASKIDVIRIGLLSSEIGEHVVGYFMAPLLENFDRQHFQIDLISCRDWHDPRGDYLCSLASSTFRLAGLDESESRKIIRDQRYDVIVDTSGYTHSASLFILADRCAPVQCHYIGFHATTGLDTIDYFIGDEEILSPELASDYTETPWQLNRPWLARSFSDGLPVVNPQATYNGPVFGCFSSLQKVTDSTLMYWGEALRAIPNSILLIKDRLTAVPSLRERILRSLNDYDVDPSRISFLGKTISWQEHMDAFNLIDIAFDTTPWSGATTAFDTLAMGVPLIAIRGNATSGRMSSSVLKSINANNWIASTPMEFASIARGMSDSYQIYRQEKQKLRDRVFQSKLFDGADLANELQNAFTQMVQIYRSRAYPLSEKK